MAQDTNSHTHAGVEEEEIGAEVAVVGGGLAGLTLAAALGSAGVATAVIDRDSPAIQAGNGFDIRTTAISFGSRQILEGVGAWQAMADQASPILDIRVADKGSPLFVHYDHRDADGDPMGWIVENSVIRAALMRRLAGLPSVRHLAPVAVTGVETGSAAVRVRMADGRSVRARLVVGADGRASLLRKLAGIDVISWPYDQSSIVCTIGHERPHHGLAVELFLPSGPFAVLPMTGNRSSVVWSEKSSAMPSYLALPAPAFEQELLKRIGRHLGAVRVIGSRTAYPLSLQVAVRQVADRLALVGEAAHAIHPVAGQGLNMGMRDVAALAEVVADQVRLGLDPGAPEVLARYQRWRRFDNISLSLVCDGLVRLFSNDIAPLKLARDLGLGAVNQLPFARRFFMRHAMGVLGNRPRLVQGRAV